VKPSASPLPRSIGGHRLEPPEGLTRRARLASPALAGPSAIARNNSSGAALFVGPRWPRWCVARHGTRHAASPKSGRRAQAGGPGLRSAPPGERGCQLKRPQFRRRRSFLIISRRLSMYSWMIRRASSERDSLGGRSTLPGRGSSGGFMPRRSAESQKEPLSQIKGTIRLRRGWKGTSTTDL
jgi:hypothetical protein